MKTKEQIELAQEMISELQDYIELAKVEKKLKHEANKEQTSKMINDIVLVIKEITEEL